jgi:hypothetical protein
MGPRVKREDDGAWGSSEHSHSGHVGRNPERWNGTPKALRAKRSGRSSAAKVHWTFA